MKKIIAFLLCGLFLVCLGFGLAGCSKEKEPETTTASTTTPETISPPTDEGKPVISIPESTADTTTAPTPETTSETTSETTAPIVPVNPNKPKYCNPLTGLEGTAKMQTNRPVAIMINNERRGCPQEGISQADVIYECLIEGGSTRLMLLVSDYEKLGTIGSVRSSRDYFLDFAQNQDALYVHAGGSPQAYSNIKARGINNMDGVNMYIPDMFFRDEYRMKNMGYEHSLMTTGAKIADGIAYKKYRTTLKEGFQNPLQFVEWSSERKLTEGVAKHIIIPYASFHFPQFIYQASTNTYLRYQFKGEPHIDKTTGKQLQVTNVITLFCDMKALNDEKGRIEVDTVGSGDGYYFYGGKYESIHWSKATRDTPMVLTRKDGSPLTLNGGKSFICVASLNVQKNITLNYKAK